MNASSTPSTMPSGIEAHRAIPVSQPSSTSTPVVATTIATISGRRALSSLRCIWKACHTCLRRCADSALRATLAALRSSLVGLPFAFAMGPGYGARPGRAVSVEPGARTCYRTPPEIGAPIGLRWAGRRPPPGIETRGVGGAAPVRGAGRSAGLRRRAAHACAKVLRMRNKLTPDDAGAEDLAVPTGGTTIRGTLRRPARGSAQRCIVIHPATAVPEALYTGFAEYLAGRGAAVITYDYRGMGRTGSARAERDVRMRDWIDGDAPAMTRWATERFPDLPQVAVGHSVGGHALALGAGGDAVRGFVTVASHAGVTAAIPAWGERMRVRAALGFVGPALSRALGYCPGWVGLGADLPGAAMRERSRWTAQPGYFCDGPAMAAADRAAARAVPLLPTGSTDAL